MAENKENAPKKEKKEKAPKKNLWKNLKAEFKKVVWPDKKTVQKETGAVVLSSLVLCIFIAILDAAIKMGVDFIAGIGV